MACVQLNGPGANQVVLHYHLHLVPRIAGDPELPVATWEIKEGGYGSDQGDRSQDSRSHKIIRPVRLDNQQDFQQKIVVHRKGAEIAEVYIFIVFR